MKINLNHKKRSEKYLLMSGDEAVAEAMRQINPDVVAAYPITPATEIINIFSKLIAEGKVKSEFIAAESEHSALSAAIGASAAGVRAMTATASQGLALMHEMLYIAAGLRLPIVMPVANRALSSPINIHCDHSDTMGSRDAGWLQFYSENVQETYDNFIQAIKISEHPDVLLPTIVALDGFITSHSMQNLKILSDHAVKIFIGEYKPKRFLLDLKHPYSLGGFDLSDYFFEHKRQQSQAMKNSVGIIAKVAEKFEKISGRRYGFLEEYAMEDAQIALVGIGSFCGVAKVAIENLREKGIKAGLVKVRVFRPFPYKEISSALRKISLVAVMDRSDSLNNFGGPLFNEVRSALYDLAERPTVINYIYGLGGRDISVKEIENVLKKLAKTKIIKKIVNYLGVRE